MSTTQVPDSASNFEIFSSLRYDPRLPLAVAENPDSYPEPSNSPYYLLAYHRDRLIAAARHFKWDEALLKAPLWSQGDVDSLKEFLDPKIPEKDKPWRLRIAIVSNGQPSCQVAPTAPIDPCNLLIPSLRPVTDAPIWKVYVDSEEITPSGFTTHKTSSRDDYNAARLRVGINSPTETAEVLMVNRNGEVMEGSITTPYFRSRGSTQSESRPSWITPPLSSGGNAGTTRRYALDQGFCIERIFRKDELVDGEDCWLSNGVRGFMRGVVVLTR
ncbi:hypothetical protein N7468_004745 [Penicillium chermesinum]|uniref:Aminodeoxychorismate lyase n=1 Tax=Penicillium chermesinum TaxID=63820 RepID=A0A9W9TSV6_9EURO|nr:uncharacterized protein N7468_004745 [Penicillium chermesinum]KAJ5240126.1 hypothetical protein N7468_004745 [Penicillium chermesinum]